MVYSVTIYNQKHFVKFCGLLFKPEIFYVLSILYSIKGKSYHIMGNSKNFYISKKYSKI